eukprot:NODE_12572_length_1216_cov_5.071625.p1 GENE.NODE_12572_length_1216_cov_5.071625~~NODE_12572_length_1216_cov_5.071625.p1  ORF type:complete len:304 (+),score=96.85 NODE_12572_length_1216_cov_5.071625:64-912(+)
MKITLRYEESDDRGLHMTLRLTLTEKYINGPASGVVNLFVDHFNKKRPENQLNAEALHLKIIGGKHVEAGTTVVDVLTSGDECFLMGETSSSHAEAMRQLRAKEPPPVASSSNVAPAGEPKVTKDERGWIRCRRFGCNRFFDPEAPPPPCVHHRAPPIFHETAKWWSCCPDRKAYDWDAFMRIAGCQNNTCSADPPEQQDQKRHLGGCDVRDSHAPMRIDKDAPPDPHVSLEKLRRGLVAVGADAKLFDKLASQLLLETGSPQAVCDDLRRRFTAVLISADL